FTYAKEDMPQEQDCDDEDTGVLDEMPHISFSHAGTLINNEEFEENFGMFGASVLNEIIDDFVNNVDDKLARIKSRIDAGEMRKLMLDAHSLKGEVSMFGAQLVREKLYVLEDKGRNEVHENLPADYETAYALVMQLKQEIGTYKK